MAVRRLAIQELRALVGGAGGWNGSDEELLEGCLTLV